jgi:predicted GNAT superfamily acetyltransferase
MTDPLDHITIRDLRTLEEYAECCEIQEETWGRGFSERVPAAILRVSQKIGGVTAGAFDANDRMIGFVFGLTGLREGRPAHWSDMLAVREEARGRHIGDRLKHFQRQQVQGIGVDVMLWTADPLVARNAHFNINRLGAMPVEYVENIYGANTGSTLHGSLPTDRTVIAWQLSRVHAPHANAGRAEPGDGGVPLANPLDHDGLPRFDDPGAAEAVRVQVPVDLVAVQRAGGDDAMRWRLSVRESFNACLAAGLTVTRFVRPTPHTLPYYVFGRP